MSAPRGVVTIDASEPIEKINEIIARDGGVIVSNFLSSDLLQECLAAGKYHPNYGNRGKRAHDQVRSRAVSFRPQVVYFRCHAQ